MSAIPKPAEVEDATAGDYSASTVDESPEKSGASPMKNMAIPSKFNFAQGQEVQMV